MSAPPIFAFESLALQQGGGWLFQNIDLFIGARDRLALIGRNGAGKTTLMKLVAGTVEADKGNRVVAPGTNIVMLEQDPDVSSFARLVDFAIHGEKGPPEYAVRAIGGLLFFLEKNRSVRQLDKDPTLEIRILKELNLNMILQMDGSCFKTKSLNFHDSSLLQMILAKLYRFLNRTNIRAPWEYQEAKKVCHCLV